MKKRSSLPRALGVSLLVAILAYAASLALKPTYRSELVLYFPQSQSTPSPLEALRGGAGGGESGSVRMLGGALTSPLVGAGGQMAAGIMTSQTAVRGCVDELGLATRWGVKPIDAYARLKDSITARVDKNGLLNVSTEARSPAEAVEVLNWLKRHLDKRSEELTLNLSRANRQFLEKRVADAELEVNRIQAGLVTVMQDSPLADSEAVMRAYLEAKVGLQKAQIERAGGERRLAVLEEDSRRLLDGEDYSTKLVALQSVSEGLKTLTGELQTRRLALADAMANFTEESPEYKQAIQSVQNAEKISADVIEASKRSVEKGLSPQLMVAKSELAALQSSSDKYREVLADYERATRDSPRQFATVERKRLEFEGAMQAYGMLREQLEIARIAEARDPSRFEVIDEPFENPKPVGPRRSLLAAVAFALALLVQLAALAFRTTPEESYGLPLEYTNGHGKHPREDLEDAEPALKL